MIANKSTALLHSTEAILNLNLGRIKANTSPATTDHLTATVFLLISIEVYVSRTRSAHYDNECQLHKVSQKLRTFLSFTNTSH
jgi:hypothetical protein